MFVSCFSFQRVMRRPCASSPCCLCLPSTNVVFRSPLALFCGGLRVLCFGAGVPWFGSFFFTGCTLGVKGYYSSRFRLPPFACCVHSSHRTRDYRQYQREEPSGVVSRPMYQFSPPCGTNIAPLHGLAWCHVLFLSTFLEPLFRVSRITTTIVQSRHTRWLSSRHSSYQHHTAFML